MPPTRPTVQQPADDSDSDNEANAGEPVFNILNGEENQVIAQLENHIHEPGHEFQANNDIPAAEELDIHLYSRRLITVIAVYLYELLCWVISLWYRTEIVAILTACAKRHLNSFIMKVFPACIFIFYSYILYILKTFFH